MHVVRSHRSLIAWMLYACVLFSALVCSIDHGQQSGLQLNGIGGLFCSLGDSSGAGLDSDPGDSKNPSLMPNMGCPLCNTFTLSIAALLCIAWLMRPAGKTFVRTDQRTTTSPRFTWPPANPPAP
ncbi:DUF2946 family protein [Pseudomonas akapageensis]|uniref:DUF2946 family protein n=1 Tax=Pseudomonas akapageensis TaxID=2609961 RepID=UPI00140DBA4C|nr:DUF2946 family protein [Pseudomonas akapageensis]